MRADQQIGICKADNLIISGKFQRDTMSVTIASGQGVLSRGTVVAKSSESRKCVILGTAASEGETLTPYGIICDEVDATSADAVTTAYRTGNFNKEALIVKENYTMTDADEAALRNGNICLDSAM